MDPILNPAGAQPNLEDDVAYQRMLREKLLKQMAEQEAAIADSAKFAREDAQRESGLRRDVGMADTIARSAAQFGSLNGKVADTSALQQSTDDMMKGRQQDLMGINKSQSDTDRLRQHLMGKLLDQEGALAKGQFEQQKLAADQARLKQEQANKDRDFGLSKRKVDLDAQKIDDKETALPKESQAALNALATKNANKASISNQMKGYLDQYRNAKTDDQKIVIGRQMLKVLNSPEGADAIGAEEANRLGSLLEYQIFNWKNPGPMFGRDLKKFDNQVVDTINSVQKGIELNNQQMADIKSGKGMSSEPVAALPEEASPGISSTATAAPAQGLNNEDIKALNWAKQNPTDPRAKAIFERLKGKGM